MNVLNPVDQAMERLAQRLRHCTSLPSPPGVAIQLIDLCERIDIDFENIIEVIDKDPSLTARLLKTANSPFYGGLRETSNLRQALILFGTNGIINLALSFALTGGLRRFPSNGVDLDRFWRRSLTVAVAARQLAETRCPPHGSNLYLAGLLHDIGILALSRAFPELYVGGEDEPRIHAFYCRRELAEIGVDHAAAGAWLLREWRLPEWLVDAVAESHTHLAGTHSGPASNEISACLALAGQVGELLQPGIREADFDPCANWIKSELGMDEPSLVELLRRVADEYQGLVPQFDLPPDEEAVRDSLVEHAAELLQLRTMHLQQDLTSLQTRNVELEAQTRSLREQTRRDSLTGLYNREYLDTQAEREFASASRHDWPLSILFLDMDDFKQVNDRYGHASGDRVLIRLAEVMDQTIRDGDLLARYGGEEFVILLPGTGASGTEHLCRRLLAAVDQAGFVSDSGQALALTTSIGCATFDSDRPFKDARSLLSAADQALYLAKREGKNRYRVYRGN